MRKEYDFARGVVGKYSAHYARGTNVILLDTDVARAFPNSQSVNDALRHIMQARLERIDKGLASLDRGEGVDGEKFMAKLISSLDAKPSRRKSK